MSLRSSHEDSSLEDEKVKKEDRPFFFTLLHPFSNNPDEEGPSDDLSKPRKVHHHSQWKTTQEAVHWVK